MASFVDRLREHPPENHRLVMWGVDPDLRTLGWAWIQASYTTPTTGTPVLEEAHFGLWEAGSKALTDIDQANAMIASLRGGIKQPWHSLIAGSNGSFLTAEAQRIYPVRDERPGTVVAKANDLLRLAQISGAFQGMFDGKGKRSYLPHVWKGNAKKEAMAERAMKRLGDARASVSWHTSAGEHPLADPSASLAQLPKKANHALDAVCLALFGIDEIASGRWTP